MKQKGMKRWLSMLLVVVMVIGLLPMNVFATDETLSVKNYDDFMSHLVKLEEYAQAYYAITPLSEKPEVLVLNFIRTGVERYQDDNWETLAGEEEEGFTQYVQEQDAANGTKVMCLRDIVVSEDFVLPNGNEVDFGHMFGCMNISYVNVGSADLSGWAGDICDLLRYSVEKAKIDENFPQTNNIEDMANYIRDNYFLKDAEHAYGMDDFYGDMDAYYLVAERKKGNQSFSNLMNAYFTESLTDEQRVVYFVNNRFGIADSQEAIRKAVFDAYSTDVGIELLEYSRGLTTYNAMRQACCYAFADYLYKIAGGKGLFKPNTNQETGHKNGYYTVFSTDSSTLAPGITQKIMHAQTADGKQIVYYVATVEVKREDVDILVNYKDNQAPVGENIGMQRVEDQAKKLVENYRNMVDENGNKVYENFNAIVATNGAGYNITTGQPSGLVVMQGVEYYPVGAPGFFAILKNGTAMIGTEADYYKHKEEIKEGIAAFGAVLIKDGKINVTKNPNHTGQRASRTAIGITADGKVIMMVLDGRQLPRSAGGSMEEIAQIMLEAGCVEAVNLDGGGSTTYLSKPAGSDELQPVNNPSDGFARSVSTSLVVVSTAKPSDELEYAIINAPYQYITAGTPMTLGVTGVSNTGNNAPIPEGSYWRVSDTSIATIDENGVFTAKANGEVTIDFIVNEVSVASIQINVVVPDKLTMETTTMNAIYGEKATLPVVATYQGNRVCTKPSDFYVLLQYSDAGIIEGLSFVPDESSGYRTFLAGAMLLANRDLYAYLQVNVYHPGEAKFDFENAAFGNRQLAWYREIENATTLDNQLYRISDPDSPVVIDYTFAMDMSYIDMPARLEPIKHMLPGGDQQDVRAWNFLLRLAERVCVQTTVTIQVAFDKALKVDISKLKVSTEYFELTNAVVDDDNVLTIVCNWKNQSKPIEASTANPICILSGVQATIKDGAAAANNKVLLAINGDVYYDIYLAASSLYSFSQDPKNQALYGLQDYIHEEDCRSDFSDAEDDEVTAANNDKGGHFASHYKDFADTYSVDLQVITGWQEQNGNYYYYKNNAPVTGLQKVPDRENMNQERFYVFDDTGKLVNENGQTGLIPYEDDLYYAVLGVAQKGWQVYEGNNYYFDADGKAVDGEYTIKEKMNPAVADGKYTPMVDYTYTFVDHVLTLGHWAYDTNITGNDGKKHTGWRYRWAGDWKDGWFEVEGEWYYASKNYPNMTATGFTRIMKQGALDQGDTQYHLMDKNEKGAFRSDYNGPYFDGSRYNFMQNGVRLVATRLYEYGGYLYFSDGSGYLLTNAAKYLNENQCAGLAPFNKTYNFDEFGRMKESVIDADTSIKPSETIQDDTISVDQRGSAVTVKTKDPEAGTNQKKLACKVGYKDAHGNYVAIEAHEDRYDQGVYSFNVTADMTEIIIVINGDVAGDGKVDDGDLKELLNKILQKLAEGQELTAEELLAADVNGDGRISAADIGRLNAYIKGKIDLDW